MKKTLIAFLSLAVFFACTNQNKQKKDDKSAAQVVLTVDENNTAVLTCREDCDTPALYEQRYEYTDFPVGTWKMYLINGVLMVPSEY